MPRGLGPRGFLTDEEKKNRPKVTKFLLLRILSYLLPYWPQFLLVFVAILLSATAGLLPSIITGRIVDEALLGKDMALLIRLLLLAFVTLAASQVIGVLESYINAWISQRIIYDMKNQMYDHLLHMPHAFFTSEKQGDIITRMNTDISGVSTVISGTLSSIVSNIATVATTLAALFSMSWQLAIVGIVVIPLLILPSRSVGKTRWQLASESQRKNDEMNQLVNETLSVSGSLLVKLFTRIFDYFDMKSDIISPVDGKKPDMTDGDICFDHVGFSYTKETSLLEDICFTVPAGKMYALVGPSGSGKSTVVNLIPRLFDVTGGRVTVAGTDVRDFDLTWLRQNIGVVSQDTYLFNGTIRENLLYARENATQAELERACRIASIHDFIAGQPEGYDTVVGNRGLKLSGGEKQRISIARVVLKDPKILILDEATSALDSISENAIQDALETLMEGRTSIVIAHRLSTILKADRILVISGGVITESGDHETLLAQNGIYRELYETQFRKVLEYEAEAHPL